MKINNWILLVEVMSNVNVLIKCTDSTLLKYSPDSAVLTVHVPICAKISTALEEICSTDISALSAAFCISVFSGCQV